MTENKDDESLISHIEALRKTLLKCLVSIAVVLPFTFLIAPKGLNYLIKILIGENKITLNYFSPVEVFLIQIKLAVILAIVVCFPYIIKQIWNFILPALYENEKRFIKSAVFVSSFLFIFGVLFSLFIILPFIINFGLSFAGENIKALFGISDLANLTLTLSLIFGLMFQTPLVVYFLIKSGVVEYNSISDKRPYVVVILLIIAAILTPPDVVSQIMLFIPTYLLFELGLLFSKGIKK